MAHYAFLNPDSLAVMQVIVGRDETDNVVNGVTYDWEQHYAEQMGMPCKRTSYNTYAGIHQLGGTPFRKNYAGIGYTYDPERDAFIPPKPYQSWTLDEESCSWIAPIEPPQDGIAYVWNENLGVWEPDSRT